MYDHFFYIGIILHSYTGILMQSVNREKYLLLTP